MTPAQRIREALERIVNADALDFVNAACRWPDPPPMDVRWNKAVCSAADHAIAHAGKHAKEALSALDTIEEESRWIPVGERLPEEGERVLLTDENGDIEIAIRRDHYGRRVWADSADDDYSWWMMEAWTHWMPLPPPPKV